MTSLILVASIGACQPQNTISEKVDTSNIVLVSDDEPGEPMIVSGTIYAPDGKTPVPRATVYVYHTDNDGEYNWLGLGRPLGLPRIKGTMISDSKGRYQFRSIRPAPYPNKKIKPHVHFKVEGNDYAEQKFKLSIVDDAPDDSSGFNDIRRLTIADDGIYHCIFNLKLKSKAFSSSSFPPTVTRPSPS